MKIENTEGIDGVCACDFVDNLPASASGITLAVSLHGTFAARIGCDGLYNIRPPQPAITKLAVTDDEIDALPFPVLKKVFPAVNSFGIHSYWGGFPLNALAAAYPGLTSLEFGERDFAWGGDVVLVLLPPPLSFFPPSSHSIG